MIQIAIYIRDESGTIRYMGIQTWDSVNQMLSHYCRDDQQTETEQMIGWPDSEVTWRGDLGYAIQAPQS